MGDSLRELNARGSLPPGYYPQWTIEDEDLAYRIRRWEADGAPVAEGVPDPLDRCYGPRNADSEQLVGGELTVAEVASSLNMTPRAVSALANKSYRLVESDLWNDFVKIRFGDLMEKKAELEVEIGEDRAAPARLMTPQAADALADLEARYKRISSILEEQSAASPAGQGWVEPGPKAREGEFVFLWDLVLLREFPHNPHNLRPPRDCPILRHQADKGLAFAIVKPGDRGRGNAWRFRRAKVPEQKQEWRRPPSYVMGRRDSEELTD